MKNYNKKIINKNFSNKVFDYENSALVQKYAVEKLLKKLNKILDLTKIKNYKILDLGSGTSLIAKEFLKINNKKNNLFFEIDLSLAMLNSWNFRPQNFMAIQCDIDNLALKTNSFDLIISSFSLQWINDYRQFFSTIFSLLKKDGVLVFAIPTIGSCQQLKNLKFIDLIDFPNLKKWQLDIENIGFTTLSIDEENYKQIFDNGIEAIKSIKKIGANYPNPDHDFSQKNFTNFRNFYKKNLHNSLAKFTIDWEINYCFFKKNV